MLGNHSARIGKGMLRQPKRNPVFLLILIILILVPLKTNLGHA